MNALQGKSDYRNDEISFPDLLHALWKQKWLVIIAMLTGFLASVAYLAVATPMYEARAWLIAPSITDIEPVNIGRFSKKAPLDAVSITKAFGLFSEVLQSESLKLEFFDSHYRSMFAEAQKNRMAESRLFAQYLKSLIIKDVRLDSTHTYVVAVKTDSKEKAFAWLNQYLLMANKKAALKLVEGVNAQNKSLAKYLKQRMDMTKDLINEIRIDKAKELEKAFALASAGGTSGLHDYNSSGIAAQHGRTAYALEQEIKLLSALQSEDSYTVKLRNMEAEYNIYRNIAISPENIKVFQFDGDIKVTDVPVSPKRKLILWFGLMGGLIAGGLLAMIRVSFFRFA